MFITIFSFTFQDMSIFSIIDNYFIKIILDKFEVPK